GKLFTDELSFNLLEYDLEFQQPFDFQLRPNNNVKGGIFNVVFKKQEQAIYLMNWMT
ncbi:type VI secretion system tube protein TssD, partial [Xanthovirga aplysinae]|uniref:type VI secretion system tube protein TssD n=1 Tax=Xanthovirga aplysinae TaxID=2529853 RepID=UPI001CA415D8